MNLVTTSDFSRCLDLSEQNGSFMYDYRRLTEEQRLAVVNDRVRRGACWHRPTHPDLGSGWYFITGACFEHRHHFQESPELTALQRRLFEALAEANCECGGWVVLPNHYHLLVKMNATDSEIANPLSDTSGYQRRSLAVFGKAIGKVHGRSAVYANDRDGTPKRQVWFRFSDRKIRSERHYWACVHYITMNPVKHGYVDTALDWPWSCVHELVAENGPRWLESLRQEYPLTRFGNGWDD
jgi:putative transposase